MNKTIRLYDQDPYATSFQAAVLSCSPSEKKEGLYEVILDQTLFFPEEGGQSPDKGTLAGAADAEAIKVVDVQIKAEVITHFLTSPLKEGTTVQGSICWNHRFSNMQQHSGEHLFSGLAHKHFGCTNVGFHLSDNEVTLDLDKPLTEENIIFLEEEVNKIIAANIERRVIFPTKEEEKDYDYRSKIEIEGQTRLVEYPGVDLCACCAPHVARTSEIGIFKVMSFKNYKGGVRVTILCGSRAFKALREEHDVLQKTARFLSAKPVEVYDLVNGLKDEIASLKQKLKEAGQAKLQFLLANVDPEAENVLVFADEADMKNVRDILNDLCTKHAGVCAIFVGSENKYRFVMGSASGKAAERLNKMKESVAIRGGGKPNMAEGSCQGSEEEIRAAFQV
ncbi:MAG: hypothetical protein KBS83_09150 [Lachnospiraceae bacterium]|nr:hypothetical protein [Candidatus Equihabitans merdae]